MVVVCSALTGTYEIVGLRPVLLRFTGRVRYRKTQRPAVPFDNQFSAFWR